jgi:hypothetical protein
MMNDKLLPAPRFLVRQGSKGWMVYDRGRRIPAMVGTAPAVNLTKGQADQIERKAGGRAGIGPKRTVMSETSGSRGHWSICSPALGPPPSPSRFVFNAVLFLRP